jgi:hypothetical protein
MSENNETKPLLEQALEAVRKIEAELKNEVLSISFIEASAAFFEITLDMDDVFHRRNFNKFINTLIKRGIDSELLANNISGILEIGAVTQSKENSNSEDVTPVNFNNLLSLMNLLPEGYQFSEDEIEDMLYIADKQEKGNVDFARFQVLSQKYKMNLNKEQQEKIQSIINKHL